jgi:hypothetical protein
LASGRSQGQSDRSAIQSGKRARTLCQSGRELVARADRRKHGRSGKFLAGLIEELIEWAEIEFKKSRPTADGSTEGEQFESAARQLTALGMTKAAALASPQGPPFPEPLDYLWAWFVQHSMGMAGGGMSYPVITWEGLHAWSTAMRIDLDPWEAAVMVTLSVVRANVHAEKMEAERKK